MERGVRCAGPQCPAMCRGTIAEPCRMEGQAENRALVSHKKP